MRWSRGTLIFLAVSWVAAISLLWMRREPWVCVAPEADLQSVAAQLDQAEWDLPQFSETSPDKTRFCALGQRSPPMLEIHDSRSKRTLTALSIPAHAAYDPKFVDNTMVVQPHRGSLTCSLFKRRFPEWWWGHFYRPELWLTIFLSGILVWQWRRKARMSTIQCTRMENSNPGDRP